jgi:MSHA pilin protein MshD
MSISQRRRARGMTLMELILAIVVIGVGLAGVLVAFNQAVLHSADPMVRKQMLAIAEEMMEEITLKPFGAPVAAPAVCGRAALATVGAYSGYAASGICDIDGTAIPALATYSVTVAVASLAHPGGVAAADSLRITTTVTHAPDETLTLVGYRTNWAK